MPEITLNHLEVNGLAIGAYDRDCDCAHNLAPLVARVERIVAARMAEAWDAGFENGIDDGFIADNPHRDAPTEPIALAVTEETPDA
ncbi:MAG: hypothetical protein ACRDTJ_04025 [Pseudonocardiaceae bacterium]